MSCTGKSKFKSSKSQLNPGKQLYSWYLERLKKPSQPDSDHQKRLYASRAYKVLRGKRPLHNRPRIFLAPAGLPQDGEFFSVAITNSPIVYCNTLRNTGDRRGVIMSTEINRQSDKLRWSEAAFYCWRDFSAERRKPVSDLRFIVHLDIADKGTLDMIQQVYDRKCHNFGLRTWSCKDSPEEFFALLGSPLGSASIQMLTDHAKSLGGRKIASISTLPKALPRQALFSINLE